MWAELVRGEDFSQGFGCVNNWKTKTNGIILKKLNKLEIEKFLKNFVKTCKKV